MPLAETFAAASGRGFGQFGATRAGQQAYTTPGTYTWVCPPGITSVCVVCIGGGGVGAGNGNGGGGGALAYKNNISVIPGNSYTINVSEADNGSTSNIISNAFGVAASAGQWGISGNGGTASGGDANYSGGSGGGGGNLGSGGGGAAGYTGNGGNGDIPPAGDYAGAGGGGIGIFGYSGSSVVPTGGGYAYSPVGSATVGQAGSGGTDGTVNTFINNTAFGGAGGTYGGGGGGARYISGSVAGGSAGTGAVRIIWGAGRSYPANAADV